MIRNIGLIILTIIAVQFSNSPSSAEARDGTTQLLSDSGDALKGKRIFNTCLTCHGVEDDAVPHVGPHLKKILGRMAGTLEGYRYSSALKSADFVWSEEKLDKWLQSPRTFLPGNRMTFMGLVKEQERKDLLAYLKQVTTSE